MQTSRHFPVVIAIVFFLFSFLLIPDLSAQYATVRNAKQQQALQVKWSASLFGQNASSQNNSVNWLDLLPFSTYTQKQVICETGGEMRLDQARLIIPPQALEKDLFIHMSRMDPEELSPLPQEITNVTKNQHGFRFLPSGHHFNEPATIELPFDPDLFPTGTDIRRIVGFFYQENTRRWTQIPQDSISLATQSVFFKTTHFTDFIAGIIQVPESPVTATLLPNSIKDFKTPDPGSGIQLMASPRASQSGSTQINYPLNIPPGRMGVQPALQLGYTNGGANDWLGLGWNLSVPAVSIDLRWGVPRFLPDQESETYLLNGQQLLAGGHRHPWRPRSKAGKKSFQPRIEGSFEKITRHGSSTKTYWWEVQDKNGGRRFYGGLPGKGVQKNAVLKDKNGNIAHWFLLESRDVHDNFVRYHYQRVMDNGQPGSNEEGYNHYLESISYTGHGQQEGPFRIRFILSSDPQINDNRRVDARIDCNLGFKRVYADLLRKVEVTYQGQLIRHYEFKYRRGEYAKMLLRSITESDRNGNKFYEHTFDYYNDLKPEGQFRPLSTPQSFSLPDDLLQGDLTGGIINPNNRPSALGGNAGKNFSVGGAITVGPPLGSVINKKNTIGGYYDYSNTTSWGINEMIDIDGDNLPDKVFQRNNDIYYRKNLGEKNGKLQLASSELIKGVSAFSYAKTKAHSYGGEATVGITQLSGYISKGKVKSRTVNPVYFSDFNNDRLVDVAVNGIVYFNQLNDDGVPCFTRSSAQTPNPIISEVAISDQLSPTDVEEELTFEEENPLHDVIRLWRGPTRGKIRIYAPIRLLPAIREDAQDYKLNDGIRATIEYDGQILATQIINNPNDTILREWQIDLEYDELEHSISSPHLLKPLFFRLHSRYDGAYDQVEWSPKIKYLNENGIAKSQIDANGKDIYQYHSEDDFHLVSKQVINLPFAGKMKIAGRLIKPQLSDNITLAVLHYKGDNNNLKIDTVYSSLIPWNEAVDRMESATFEVEEEDRIQLLISANSNVDWQSISWEPMISYLSGPNGNSLLDEDNKPVLTYKPAVGHFMYNQTFRLEEHKIIDPEKDFELISWFYPPSNGSLPIRKAGNFSLVVKGPRKVYASQTVSKTFFGAMPPAGKITIPAEQLDSDTLYVEAYFSDYELAEAYYLKLYVSTGKASVFSPIKDHHRILGPLYRGWGQFAYKAEGEQGEQPIKESIIREAFREYEDMDNVNAESPEDLEESSDPSRKDFAIMYADMDLHRWQGYDDLTYVTSQTMSSSRKGEDNPRQAQLLGQGTGMRAPIKVSKTTSGTFSGGITLSIPFKKIEGVDSIPASATYTDSYTNSSQQIDVLDFNKDGYLDLVANGKIQYTNPFGGRIEELRSVPGNTHRSSSSESGFSLSGIVGGATNHNTQQTSPAVGGSYSPSNGSFSLSQNITLTKHTSVGFNSTYNENEDETDNSWTDINGDGLIDIVYKDGTARLNYGYFFGKREEWNFKTIRKGHSATRGGSLSLGLGGPLEDLFGNGFSKWHGSITVGKSFGITDNYSIHGLQDVNGDGLTDILMTNDNNQLIVRLNYGTTFGPEILWTEKFKLDAAKTTGESLNGAFTICIPVFFVRICVNPRGNKGKSLSRPQTRITDLNGDGYPDLLKSNKEDQLIAQYSNNGRTNMLKTVHRPLGGSFTLNYRLTGTSYDMPDNHWVLSEVVKSDGLSGDGINTVRTTFEYGHGYYDRREKEFYGFDRVITREYQGEDQEEEYRRTIATYRNNTYYDQGLLAGVEILDQAGRIFKREQYIYELRDPGNGTVLPDTFSTDIGAAFPALIEKTDFFHEGAVEPGLVHKIEYDYDKYGNVIYYRDHGDGSDVDWVSADITYHHQTAPFLHAIPKSIKVFTHQGLMRQRATQIDKLGNVEWIDQYLNSGETARFDFGYDDYGNQTRITYPPNYRGQRLFYDYKFDDEVHTYVTRITDAFQYTSSSVYDVRYGQILESTDLNGVVTEYELDEMGRLIRVKGPFEQDYTIAIKYYPDENVPHAVVRHFDPEHDEDILTTTFIDGFKRMVQVKKTGVVANETGTDFKLVGIVSGRPVFDAFGRTVETRFPTTEAHDKYRQFNTGEDPEAPTKTAYDILDRPLNVTLPDGSVTKTNYSIGKNNSGITCFITKMTDPEGNEKDSYSDIRNRLRSTTDYGPDGEIWTSYSYNPISELLKVTDQGGHETIYTYDQLGRKTSVRHPDAGWTEFTYDLAGNLTHKTTPNIRETISADAAVQYFYEYNRLERISYPKNFQNNVQYTYGKPGDPHHRAGRIWLQEDASGATEFFYSPLGQVTKTIRTVLVNPVAILTYVSETEYDTWNRVKSLKYPDGEVVSYHYNRAGKLERMTGRKEAEEFVYVDQLGYNKFEDRSYLRLGNQSETFYTYDEERRWLSDMVVRHQRSGTFIDNDYQYDRVGNITRLANRADTEQKESPGGPSEHRFFYDKLYRLEQAEGLWSKFGKEETYSLSMEYDNLHNILSKTKSITRSGRVVPEETYTHSYEYSEGRPHVASQIGEYQYQYDDNGNLVNRARPTLYDERELLWDEENRLRGIVDNGYLSRYTYDAQGERVVKSHGLIQAAFFNGGEAGFVNHEDNYTVYVSPYLVAKEDGFTKHYYIEGQRIVSKIGSGNFQNNYAPAGTGITAGQIDFLDRLAQIRQLLLEYYAQFLVPPGEPFQEHSNVQPEVTGIGFDPIFAEPAEANSAPEWVSYLPVGEPDPNGPPGPPFWVDPPPSNADVEAGYGFDPESLGDESRIYFYHPDHLGSTSYITNGNGEITQHVEYLPFGEIFTEEFTFATADLSQPYLFNGKELDRETGLYYYGARYYDPKTSIWASVDPLAEKYAGWSPYHYTLLNPIKYIDPDGRKHRKSFVEKVKELDAANLSRQEFWQEFRKLRAQSEMDYIGTVINGVLPNAGTILFEKLAGYTIDPDPNDGFIQIGKIQGGVLDFISSAILGGVSKVGKLPKYLNYGKEALEGLDIGKDFYNEDYQSGIVKLMSKASSLGVGEIYKDIGEAASNTAEAASSSFLNYWFDFTGVTGESDKKQKGGNNNN